MEVGIISTQHIKPSSLTPQHLKTFKLSLLDQFIPSPYAPIILFYPTDESTSHLEIPRRLELLKKSLSNTLTSFYPLAGKIRNDLSIECSDQGAYYVEARVNCRLNEFLNQPDLLFLPRFLPREFILDEPTAGTYVTNIQVNMFECGGIAIGICISHKILDGAALSTFLKAWTATARGCKEAIYPNFIATSLFPTDDLWLRDSSLVMWGSLFRKGKSITRRMIFGTSSIAALKAQATIPGRQCPTRVEAVSAFLWKCTMDASKGKNGFQRPSLLTHLVNLRRRMVQPTENSTGNLLWIASAKSKVDNKSDLPDLVGRVREAISRVDGDFLKKLGDDKGKSLMCETLREIGDLVSKDGLDHFGFSSWCKFGFYEADFGWGKPVWVSSFGMENSVYMNLIILVDTRFGDGIEAWVTLDEQDMAILERDEELLRLAMFDPSPLMISKSPLN
ncbi:PREDICTED: vinorine synthase-like [Theobroma cacao]|uniref:Vinorine synthase-like n=1 Tax=Theobroma cacao TaxID=3641 RepID=A0AB32WQZ8_THECC|nr:PREDICTED: vinorine synthase-like [Theobroma cacao]